MFRAAWLGFSILEKFLFIAGILGVITLTLAGIHHHIDKGGYDRAMNEIAVRDAKRAADAQKAITLIGANHEKTREKRRAAAGYNSPSSPLVGDAIDGVRDRPQ